MVVHCDSLDGIKVISGNNESLLKGILQYCEQILSCQDTVDTCPTSQYNVRMKRTVIESRAGLCDLHQPMLTVLKGYSALMHDPCEQVLTSFSLVFPEPSVGFLL